MAVFCQPLKTLVWGIVLVMVVLAMGCGHRSLHGSKAHYKKFTKPKIVAHQQKVSTSTDLPGRPGGEGYFSDGASTFADLLNEESMIQEDPKFGNQSQAGDLSNDYWLNRTRAEQFTAQSGLEDIHFAFNSIQLSEQAKNTLMANAEWLKAHPEAEVTIEGHCDERGTSSYNYVLGEKRALRTKAFLASLGISSDRLQVISFGKDNPACWDPTEPCYKKNRRAHLVLGVTVASTAMR